MTFGKTGCRNLIFVVPPYYDAAVEYLESTETQWIDTEIVGNERLIIDAMWIYGASDAGATLFGSRQSANSRALALTGYSRMIDHRLYLNYGSASGYLKYESADLYGHLWEIHVENRNSRLICDGLVVSTGSAPTSAFTTPSSMILFGCYSNGTIALSRNMRIYSWTVMEGNTLLQDFIPVRFTNELGQSEGAMYDYVTRKLFRNAGTGSFVIGPDVTTGGGVSKCVIACIVSCIASLQHACRASEWRAAA